MGMFPPMIAKGLVGDSIAQIWQNPSVETISYLVGGIILWGLMIWGSQKFARYYQSRKEANGDATQSSNDTKDEGEKCAA